jgi:hypothetical protein
MAVNMLLIDRSHPEKTNLTHGQPFDPIDIRIYRDNEDSLGQLRVAPRQLGAAGGLTGEDTAMNSRLIGQLEEVRRVTDSCRSRSFYAKPLKRS